MPSPTVRPPLDPPAHRAASSADGDVVAFVAGSAYPVVIVPFAYLGVAYHIHPEPELAYGLVPLFLPAVFGLANVAFVRWGRRLPGGSRGARLWVAGMIFGLGLTLYGTFVEDVPGRLFQWQGPWRYATLILAPLLYGLVWRYVIGGLNRRLGLG